jgi:hypothetical protein
MTDAGAISLVRAAIVAAWQPFVTEAQACAEADGFIRRAFSMNDNAPDDFDQVLTRVAAAVQKDSPGIAAVIWVPAENVREA